LTNKQSKRLGTVRYHAVCVVKSVIDHHKSLNFILPLEQQKVTSEQRPLFSQLCYGSLRWYVQLNFWLTKMVRKPLKAKDRDIHFTLIIGLFQLAYLAKPQHAVIHETVNVSKELNKVWAKALINGVLRSFLRQQDQLRQALSGKVSLLTAAPDWLFEAIDQAYPDTCLAILKSLNDRAPMTLRVNSLCTSRATYSSQLQAAGYPVRQSELAPYAIILETACDVEQLPGFTEGYCTVQDEAAQLAAVILQPAPGQKVLDACSAPGGKTTALLEAFPSIRVCAVDANAERQARTLTSLQRLQLRAQVITAEVEKPETWWDGDLFDHILLDAPCSSTGVIRRHPDIKHLRRRQDIAQLTELQFKMLKKLWSTLKTGGTLLYATCSILPQENTRLIARFLSVQSDALVEPTKVAGDIDSQYGCQLLPQTHGHDGFYYCLLRKTA